MIELKKMTLLEYHLFIENEIMQCSAEVNKKFGIELPSKKHQEPFQIRENFENLNTNTCKFWTLYNKHTKQAVGGVVVDFYPNFAYIVQFLIYESFRNKEFGKLSLLSLEKKLINLGVSKIKLNVFAWNNIAIQVYEKLNYASINYHNSNVEMEKKLF